MERLSTCLGFRVAQFSTKRPLQQARMFGNCYSVGSFVRADGGGLLLMHVGAYTLLRLAGTCALPP